jgi:hypothetical protein
VPASYTHGVPPEAQPGPQTGPIKVDVVRTPPASRDLGWWVTTVGPVVIAALALVVAIVSLNDANRSAQTAQNATARTYASEVSFISGPTAPQFEIDNGAPGQITSVLVQAAPHDALHDIGTIPRCTGITIPLPGASAPVIYFRDANGLSWELPVNGVAEQAPDPNAILSLLPVGAVTSFSSSQEVIVQLHGC